MDLWPLLPLAGLLVLSGLFSGAETALFSVPHETLRDMKESGPAGALVARLRNEPRQLLLTLLFGNLAVNILYFAASTLWVAGVAADVGPATAGLAGVVIFVVFLVGGEILPKTVAVRVPSAAARLVAFPVALVATLIAPVRGPIDRFVAALTTAAAGPEEPTALTPDELAALATLAEQIGSLGTREGQMLREVFEAADVRVKEFMIPRVDLAAAPVGAGWGEVLAVVRETGHTAIPLYRDTPDLIVGIVHARQALFTPDEPPREVMARPFFVPESMTLDVLLRECRARRVTEAIVVDEYGGTEGMVEVDDAVGEIVGAVADEYGPQPLKPEVLGPGRVVLPGAFPVRDWQALLGPRGAAAPVATLGGYVTWLMNRIPQVDDVLSHGGLRFTVKAMRGNRVSRVLLELESPTAAAAPPPTPPSPPPAEASP